MQQSKNDLRMTDACHASFQRGAAFLTGRGLTGKRLYKEGDFFYGFSTMERFHSLKRLKKV